jgi:hypothetical protein
MPSETLYEQNVAETEQFQAPPRDRDRDRDRGGRKVVNNNKTVIRRIYRTPEAEEPAAAVPAVPDRGFSLDQLSPAGRVLGGAVVGGVVSALFGKGVLVGAVVGGGAGAAHAYLRPGMSQDEETADDR